MHNYRNMTFSINLALIRSIRYTIFKLGLIELMGSICHLASSQLKCMQLACGSTSNFLISLHQNSQHTKTQGCSKWMVKKANINISFCLRNHFASDYSPYKEDKKIAYYFKSLALKILSRRIAWQKVDLPMSTHERMIKTT